MIAVGITKPNSNGAGVNSSNTFGMFQSSSKGSLNCIINTGSELEPGDLVYKMWKDLNTFWPIAIYNGGSISDTNNYTPFGDEIITDYVCPVPSTTPPSGGSGTPPSGGGSTLPLVNFYYEGLWETGDVLHQPEINSWVDYLDEFGVEYRFMIGGLENGCQLIQASSILDTNGCAPCTNALLTYEVDNRNLYQITVSYIDADNVSQSSTQPGDSIVTYDAIEGSLSTQNDGVTINIIP